MRLVVGMTGATGAAVGIRLLEALGDLGIETDLVLSDWAKATIKLETDTSVDEVRALASHAYSSRDLAAGISSGSFRTDGMVVIPCSVKTLSGIANCYDDNLVVRAADIMLKERRRLVLVVRETPLHLSHLRLMTEVTAAGGIIVPPVPAFYHHPQTVEDIVDQTVGRVFDLFGLDLGTVHRWEGGQDAARRARAHRNPQQPPRTEWKAMNTGDTDVQRGSARAE